MRKAVKTAVIAACALIALALGAYAQEAADPVEGFWLGVNSRGVVEAGWELYQSDGFLCGRILSALGISREDIAKRCKDTYPGFPLPGKVNQMSLIGTPWIFGLIREKPGVWAGGYVIDPSNGSLYKCKITYHAADGKRYVTDTLEMRGEIGLGIGGSQNWRAATKEEAGALR